MKAILIVDINDDSDLSSEADVIIDNGDFHLETKAFLKPLPKKKEEFQEALEHFYGNLSRELHFACEGWNACLDEILGEEKE